MGQINPHNYSTVHNSIRRIVHYYPRALVGDGGPTVAMWGWANATAQFGMPSAVIYDAALHSDSSPLAGAVTTIPVRHRASGRLYHPVRLNTHLCAGDLLILHSAYSAHNLVAAGHARKVGIPYVVVPHGAYDSRSRGRRRALKRGWEIFERPYLERALAVHLFHIPEKDGLRLVAPRARLIIAPTGVAFSDSPGWDGGSGDYLAWIGRYDIEHKGLDLLVAAIASLPPRERPRLELRGRESTNTLKQVLALVREWGLSETIGVGGSIEAEEKDRFMRQAIAWVHPSRWESHSLALGEALNAGLPCLVTSSNPMAPLLSSRKAAVVVDPNPSAIARGLRLLHEDGSSYSQRGQLLVTEEFAWPRVANSFLEQASALLG